jgi:hypothetical protein
VKVFTVAAMSVALVLALCSVAHAGKTRVVVAGPENDAVSARLEKELTALGFDPVRVDEPTACSPAAMAAWIEEMHASGAACSDGKSVTVFVAAPSGLKITDVVRPRPEDDAAPDVVAMRAAEVTRASIELSASEPEAAPPAARPKAPPTWSNKVSPRIDEALRDSREPAAVPRYLPTFAASGGLSAVIGADVTSAAVDVEMDIRLLHRLALAARGAIPISRTRTTAQDATIEMSSGLFGVGPLVALAPASSRFIPRIGGGVGVAWLNAKNVFPEGAATVRTTIGQTDDIMSPMTYLNAALSIRVGGPVRLVLDGLLGTTAHRMVVRAGGGELAYWGQPFGTLAMRVELVTR